MYMRLAYNYIQVIRDTRTFYTFNCSVANITSNCMAWCRSGNRSRLLHCDWLPERARWHFIQMIWPVPRAGKMNQILRCEWFTERTRWSYLARSGLPAVSRKKNISESHIINSLLTKLCSVKMAGYWPPFGYWPRPFFACLRTCKRKKKWANIQSYYTTQAVRGPITKINQSNCSIAGPIFSKYRTGHCPELSCTCVFAVFAFFSGVTNLLLTKLFFYLY